MLYIDWNIKCSCEIDKIIDLINKKSCANDCVIALQEVMPEKAKKIAESFENTYWIVYSLDYRPADAEFDTDNRRLGVMLLISKDYQINNSGVFERCLFPERTLYATVSKDGTTRRIATFHSITGVAFKMGKAVQFRSFAECIRNYCPDIVSLDANEPSKDHYDMAKLEFFDQGDKGKGARIFWEELYRQNLCDAFIKDYDVARYVPGKPLAISHMVQNKFSRRYDFVFVKRDIDVKSVCYLYEEARAASSDHAIVIANVG